jgi:hypothetical protein
MTDIYDDMFKQAEEQANEERWDFEENPEIRGILVGVGTGPDVGWGKFHILRIKDLDEGKTWGIAVFGKVFRSRTEELAPKIGSPIAVKYDGLKSNKDGSRQYKSWLVVARDSDHAFWFQQIAGLAGRPSTGFTQGHADNDDDGADTDFF